MSNEELDTAELRAYRMAARTWLAETMQPLGRRSDGSFDTPDDSDPEPRRVVHLRALQAKLFDAGYAGITYPKEYGGGGLSLDFERVFFEESAAYEMPTQMFGVSLNILGKTLLAYGTDEQRASHLPKMLRGEEIWLQFLSEPSGGSDLAGLLTRATRDGESFIVNGQKTWSTGAQRADFALCPARTDWDVPKHKGISVLILDLRWPGIEIRRIKQIDGSADFCEEFLTDVVVPEANLVGDENQGWAVCRGLLEIEHEWVGRSGGGGIRVTDVQDLVALVKRRGLEGDPGIRRAVAEIHAAQRVHELVAARVGDGMEAGQLSHGYGGILKLGMDIVRQRRAELALALSGERGVAWRDDDEDASWATAFLEVRSASIGGGSDEIQRNNVSERALGLPREPTVDRDLPFNQVLRGTGSSA